MLIAALLVLAGAVARLYDPGRMVVWHDEVFTAVRVFGYPQEEIAQLVFSGRLLDPDEILAFQRPSPERGWGDTFDALAEHPEHSPLYYLAARLAADAVSEPLLALRGTSAALALLLIPAVFWLARELFRDPRPAWVAAALIAVSPLHLLYAQEAREYALWTVATAAASAAFLRALRRQSTRDWALYGILIAVGFYSHLLFMLVLAAHASYGLASMRGDRRRLASASRWWFASVALGAALFLPWILVLLDGADRVEQVTGWMTRDVGPARILGAWGMHLVRTFADIPAAGAWLLLALLPMAWMLWYFAWHGPRGAVLFCALLFAVFAAAVLVPDLIKGGSRSLHPRYALPAFLAVELAVAWVLAYAWDATVPSGRRLAGAGLVMVLGAGAYSGLLILQADTWWSKNFSEQNRSVARLVNAAERPLVLATETGVALGEIISLSYDLGPAVRVWGEPRPGVEAPMAGFATVFAVTPSAELRAALGPAYQLVPVSGTWQWFAAEPSRGGVGP